MLDLAEWLRLAIAQRSTQPGAQAVAENGRSPMNARVNQPTMRNL
ncbi:hypothetical protein [Thermoleptolyngbya sp.]